MIVAGGAEDVTTYFMMRLSATGLAATGLTATDFDLQYTRSGSAPSTKVDATLNGNGVGGAHSDSTVIEVDATSSPGLYRVDWVDDAFEEGVQEVILSVTVATAFSESLRVELSVINDIWDRVLTGATHNINNSAGKRLRQVSGIVFNSGTAQSGGNNSIQLESGSITSDDMFRRSKVIIIGGTGTGQEAIITSTVASTDTCTTTPAWITNPDSSSEYEVLPAQVNATVTNGGYDNSTVYVDTVNGSAGTEIGVNGTSTNPSDSLTDAYIIATANNIIRFEIEPGSTITLPASSTNRVFSGSSYNILLNSADIEGSSFTGASSVTGLSTGGTAPPSFFTCGIGSATLPPSNGFQCGFFGTFTMQSAGSYTWGGSATVFDSPFIIDYGSGLNASKFFIQSWGGGAVEIQNAGAGTGSYVFNMNGTGDLTVNANCSATTEVVLHGTIDLTNNASGLTVTDNGNILIDKLGGSLALDDIADAVWDEERTDHTDAGTFGKYLDDQISSISGGGGGGGSYKHTEP